MSRRGLAGIVAAAALLSAAPVLAEESSKDVETQKLPACCERMAKQLREHQERLDRAEKRETQGQARQKVAPPVVEDPYAPNSWGG